MQVDGTQSVKGLNRTKKQRKYEFALLLELGHPSSSALRHRQCWLSGGLKDFRLRLNYTISFPGSPFGRWQIVGLLSLYSNMSQFL